MPLTREQAEVILISRVGKLMTAAGLDGATVDGTNAALTDPLGWAIRRSGGTQVSVAEVADADLATLGDSYADQLLDLAELRALESALGNYDAVTIRVGQRSESLSDLAGLLERRIEAKRKWIEVEYGLGSSSLSAGVIDLDFAAGLGSQGQALDWPGRSP